MKLTEKLINTFFDRLFKRTGDNEWFYEKDLIRGKIQEAKQTGKIADLENETEIRYYRKLLDQAKDLLSIPTFKSMLIAEYGSGTGLLSLYMAKEGGQTTLIDTIPECLEYSHQVFKSMKRSEFKGRFATIKGDFLEIHPSKKFDLIHSVGIVEHFDNATSLKLVRKIVKDVKKNGQVLIGVPNFLSPDLLSIWAKSGKGNEKFYSKKKLRSLLANSGLVDIKVTTSTFFYPSFIPSWITKFESLENFLGKRLGLGFLVIGSGKKP